MRRQAARHLVRSRRRTWLWPDRNPLRRSCDRVEALIFAVLVTAFGIGGPLAALAAGDWAYGSALRATVGDPAALPLNRSQVHCAVVEAALLAIIVLALVLAGAGLAVRHLLDRRRLDAWDAEWRAIGPKWSRHR